MISGPPSYRVVEKAKQLYMEIIIFSYLYFAFPKCWIYIWYYNYFLDKSVNPENVSDQ